MRPPPSIPRRIIQTARRRELPPLARAAARNLRLLHPDWEFLFFDDDEVLHFVTTEFPRYRGVFDSFPHRIQRYDFFRYLAVLRHGGFYLDLDVLLAESLDELLPHRCVFPFEELSLNRYLREAHGIDWELGNYAFGAAAGDPFLAQIVGNCIRARTDRAWAERMFRGIPRLFRTDFDVLHTTGPGLVTRTFAESGPLAHEVTILTPDLTAPPAPGRAPACDVADPALWHQFGRYGVHLMAASWRPRRSFLLRKASLLWETRQRRRAAARHRAQARPLAARPPAATPRLA